MRKWKSRNSLFFSFSLLNFEFPCEPGWDRTNGPLLKRQMLYH